MTPPVGIGTIATQVEDNGDDYEPRTLSIYLTSAAVDAWLGADDAALAALGNPSLYTVWRAASHVAAVLGRLRVLIPSNRRGEDLDGSQSEMPLPPPYVRVATDGLRHSTDMNTGPRLHIMILPKHRKAWLTWITERLAEIAEVISTCDHGQRDDAAHPNAPIACRRCKAADDEMRAKYGMPPRPQPPASMRLRAVR